MTNIAEMTIPELELAYDLLNSLLDDYAFETVDAVFDMVNAELWKKKRRGERTHASS